MIWDHDSVENCCAGNRFCTLSDLRQGPFGPAFPFHSAYRLELPIARSQDYAPFLNSCLKSGFELHYMV